MNAYNSATQCTVVDLSKIQLFLEGYKNLRNRPYGFDIYLENVKTIRTIAQIVAELY